MENPYKSGLDAPQSIDNTPSDIWQTLAGVALFAAFGISSILMEIPHEWMPSGRANFFWVFLVTELLLPPIGFAAGWVTRFPRWSYAYILVTPLLAWYMGSVTTPGLQVFGIPVFGRAHWGERSWLVFCLAMVVALLLTRSLRPLAALFTNIWRDWTLASFSIFGCLPWLTWVSFDEIDRLFSLYFMVGLTVVFVTTATLYLRSKHLSNRALILLGGAVIAWGATTAGNAIYWDGRVEDWMVFGPDHWYLIVSRMTIGLLVMIIILFSPAVLGLVRFTRGRQNTV